jgi:hypothetical protein
MTGHPPGVPAAQESASSAPVPPRWRIGTVPVYGDLILAPMAGYGDLPFRSLCREQGSAVSYVPLILADAVTRRADHNRDLMRSTWPNGGGGAVVGQPRGEVTGGRGR